MFNFDEKRFLCGSGGVFPPERPDHPHHPDRPHFTLTEEMHHTITEMRATIDRLLKFEARVQNEVHDLMSKLTSDNVLFKDTFNQAHLLFLQEVKNEVNLFESNVDNTIKLFTDNLTTEFEGLDERTQALIAEYLTTYEAKLKEFETEYEAAFEAYKAKLEALVESNSAANAEAFADFQRKLTTELNMFEADINNKVALLTESLNESLETFRTTWTEVIEQRLDDQDARVANAENYMKINLEATVRTELGDMIDSGEMAELFEGEAFGNVVSRVDGFETTLTETTSRVEALENAEPEVTETEFNAVKATANENKADIEDHESRITTLESSGGGSGSSPTMKNFYVNNAIGSDENDGSSNAPFATLKKAIDEAGNCAFALVYVYGTGTAYQEGVVDVCGSTNIKVTGNSSPTIAMSLTVGYGATVEFENCTIYSSNSANFVISKSVFKANNCAFTQAGTKPMLNFEDCSRGFISACNMNGASSTVSIGVKSGSSVVCAGLTNFLNCDVQAAYVNIIGDGVTVTNNYGVAFINGVQQT